MTDQKEIVLTTNEYYHPGCAVTNTEVKLPPGVDFKGWEATLLVRDKDNLDGTGYTSISEIRVKSPMDLFQIPNMVTWEDSVDAFGISRIISIPASEVLNIDFVPAYDHKEEINKG